MDNFSSETLPRHPKFIRAFTRTRIANGWYVRVIFCHEGVNGGVFCESAVYVDDPEHAWDTSNDEWRWIADEPRGGIFQCAVPGGWLMLASAKGEATFGNWEKLDTRFGSLVYVPDREHVSLFAKTRELNGDLVKPTPDWSSDGTVSVGGFDFPLIEDE